MKKTVYITDPEVLAIAIKECHEPLIDLKQYPSLAFGPPPENEWTRDCYTKLRRSVYLKLLAAESELPHGWRFRLYEGFRSLKVQKMLFDCEYKRVALRHPNLTKSERFRETTRLVSPVINPDGSKNIPAHNTGGAIDIEIIDSNGQVIDMGMEAKDWGVVKPELCLTSYKNLSKEVKQNRQLLLDLLTSHGFVNYPTEWWHFSYGDRYWAYHQHKCHAIYGSADALIWEKKPVYQ
ncbi:MAG: M15 family metallopeptidase [Gammaproteobacteria bacterium]|nr:M15 family metallopeptidase [Gammaproteobacteria bacterium]